MINHSELMEKVQESLARVQNDILKASRDGVVEEGGPLVAPKEAAAPTASVSMSQPHFSLGPTSIARLAGVHPTLVKVVKEAIILSSQDFTVMCGVRTLAAQKDAMARGTTRTMHSQHLTQADGFSHAVDLVPWVNGKVSWDWSYIYPIAFAMDQAATNQGVAANIRWGGAWDRRLSDYGNSVTAYRNECAGYASRHTGPDFLDGPHFELVL